MDYDRSSSATGSGKRKEGAERFLGGSLAPRSLGLIAILLGCAACWAIDPGTTGLPVPQAPRPLADVPLPNGRALEYVANGLTSRDLITLVYQGQDCTHERREPEREGAEGGYCATLAAIKAGIATFGVSGVAAVSPADNGGVSVTLRDLRKFSLSSDELKVTFDSAPGAGIVPGRCGGSVNGTPREVLARLLQDWITLYFGVAAKSLQTSDAAPKDCRAGIAGFRRALSAIRNGFANKQAFALLGVEQYTFDSPRLDRDTGVIWTRSHVMFTSGGLVDRWGTVRELGFFAVLHGSTGLSSRIQDQPAVGGIEGGWDPEDTVRCRQQ